MQVFQVLIDLDDAFLLDSLDAGHSESIRAIDCDAEVVIVLDYVTLDVALCVQVIVNVTVHDWVLSHGDGARLDKEGQHR